MARKVEYRFDPFEEAGLSKEDFRFTKTQFNEIMSRTKDLVLESVLTDMGSSRSSVTGRQFKKLDPKYAAKKRADGDTPVANLESGGALKDSLKVVQSGPRLVLTTDPSQMDKSDGHNNHSGESKLPERKFIPDGSSDERFRPGIREDIATIIRDTLGEED